MRSASLAGRPLLRAQPLVTPRQSVAAPWGACPAPLLAVGGCRRRGGGAVVVAQQTEGGERKDPAKDPNYRRGSQNDYWRKRTNDRRSSRGSSVSVSNDKRRRGRAAHLRSPDDTPLRDGNRDRLMGLLTDRAARTLSATVGAGNPDLDRWLSLYLGENSIPKDGNWSDVSGENFMRTLLTRPVEEISGSFSEEDDSFLTQSPVGGDPRALAASIMELRHSIALEWIQELQQVKEENMLLLNETLMRSMQPEGAAADASGANGGAPAAQQPAEQPGEAPPQPGEAPTQPSEASGPKRAVDIEALDDSAGGGDD